MAYNACYCYYYDYRMLHKIYVHIHVEKYIHTSTKESQNRLSFNIKANFKEHGLGVKMTYSVC